MVTSINVAATNPLLAYQTAPIAPIAPIPGTTPGAAASDPAAERQSQLEAKIKDFEDYLNGRTNDEATQQSSTPSDQNGDLSPTDPSSTDSLSQTDSTTGDDASQIFTSYALTNFEVQIQNFEAYLNEQTGFHAADDASSSSQDTTASSDDAAAELQAQLQALEAYVARQAAALTANRRSAQDTSSTVSAQPASTSADTAASQNPPVTAKPIDLGAIVNALERYLSKQGPAAISDPIQGQSTTPIPAYQTVQGRQDPLPVNGPEQNAKTSTQQSDTKHETLNRDLGRFLDDLAILNLVGNKKTIEFDPVRDLETKSTYKPPGESSPI